MAYQPSNPGRATIDQAVSKVAAQQFPLSAMILQSLQTGLLYATDQRAATSSGQSAVLAFGHCARFTNSPSVLCFQSSSNTMGTDIAEWQSVSYRSSGALAENAQVHTCTERGSLICSYCSLSLQNKGIVRCTSVTARSGLSLPVVLTWMDCALGKDWAAAHDSAARTPTMALIEEAKNLIPAELYRYTCSTSEVVSRTSGCPDHTKGDNAP